MEGNLKSTLGPKIKKLLSQRPFPLDTVDAAQLDNATLAGMIDHTLLKPEATPAQIDTLCDEAATHHFASVCVNPSYVPHATHRLNGAKAKVCTVIGFPLGATATAVKEFETQLVIERGATEVDMVINVGWLKAQELQQVLNDIQTVVEAAHAYDVLVKVIIETALLTDGEKVTACLLAKMAGADFVKTSTGFSSGGATVEDIALMRATVGPDLGVKASGGVRSRDDALQMIAAGATRIGASAGLKIIEATTAVSERGY